MAGRVAALTCVLGGVLCAQANLALSTAAGFPGASAVLTLSLDSSGVLPAGVQWQLNYDPAAISSIDVRPGTSALVAGKSLMCDQARGSVICILAGDNQVSIASGVLAEVMATPSRALAPISIGNSSAAGGDGSAITLNTRDGGFTEPPNAIAASNRLDSAVCSSTYLRPGEYADCEVTLRAAPARPITLGVSAGSGNLEVPNGVGVSAGSAKASFRIRALWPPVTHLVRVTVTLSPNDSITFIVTLNAGARLGR